MPDLRPYIRGSRRGSKATWSAGRWAGIRRRRRACRRPSRRRARWRPPRHRARSVPPHPRLRRCRRPRDRRSRRRASAPMGLGRPVALRRQCRRRRSTRRGRSEPTIRPGQRAVTRLPGRLASRARRSSRSRSVGPIRLRSADRRMAGLRRAGDRRPPCRASRTSSTSISDAWRSARSSRRRSPRAPLHGRLDRHPCRSTATCPAERRT